MKNPKFQNSGTFRVIPKGKNSNGKIPNLSRISGMQNPKPVPDQRNSKGEKFQMKKNPKSKIPNPKPVLPWRYPKL
jgi:hypothetical protein